MVPFAYPDENLTDIMGLIHYANTLTNSFLGTGILIALGVVCVIATKNFTTEKSFGFATFIVMLSAVLFRFMNMINDAVLYTCVIAFVACVIWMYFMREQESP